MTNDATASEQPGPEEPDATRRVAFAGVVGNVLEWYDFALYGYLATIIAKQFFPPSDNLTGLISTYAVFAIGFFARPLGAALFGVIGDRFGRKRLLMISVIMMGVPTFLIGTLPTYSEVGILSPALLILVRFLQGMSTGGEFSGSIIFMVEHAPAGRRGLFGSLSNMAAIIGGLLGSAVAWTFVTFIPSEQMHEWGWRLPFLTGILITFAGIWLRLGLPESPTFKKLQQENQIEQQPLRKAFCDHPREIALTAGLNWTVSTGYYVVFVWFTSDMSKVVGMSLSSALAITTAGLLVGTIATPLAGMLSDRVGSRRVLLVAGLAILFLSVPLLLLAGSGKILAAAAAEFALAVLVATFLGVLPAVFVVLNEAKARCSALSVGYNLAVAVFGGTAPLIATLLIKYTGWQAAPGIYLALSALTGLFLLRFIPKTAPNEKIS